MHTSNFFGLLALVATTAGARSLIDLSFQKRHPVGTQGTCALQPAGNGPLTTPDTADAFVNNPAYDDIAFNAAIPSGWTLAYEDCQAATINPGYLGVEELKSYDPSYCAAQCCKSWAGCSSFNIYLERNPIQDSADACPNPASTTRIKCAFFNASLVESDVTNYGQYCFDFQVVIAGSNGYNSNGACPAPSASTTTTTTAAASTTPVSIATTTSSAATTPAQCTPGSSLINGRQCTTLCNTDRPGGDYANKQLPSFSACTQACAADPKCVTAQYHEDNQYCYFKSTKNDAVSAPGEDTVDCGPAQCISGTRVINGRTCTVSCGIDRPGGDYANAPATSFEACVQACAADSRCVTAQYHEDSQYCYFKNVLNTAVSAPGEDTVDCVPIQLTSTTTTSVTTTTSKSTTSSTTTTTSKSTTSCTTTSKPAVPTTTSTTKAVTTTTTTKAVPTTTTKAVTTTTTTKAVTTTTTTTSTTTSAQCVATSQVINGRSCTRTCGLDRPGDFYNSLWAGSSIACFKACESESKCVSGVYVESNGWCYLKSTLYNAVYVSGIDTVDCAPVAVTTTTTTTTAAASTTTPAQCIATSQVVNGRKCTRTCGLDRPGDFYNSLWAGSSVACFQACESDSKCASGVYVESNGWCYIKGTQYNAVWVAGIDTVDCTPSPVTTTSKCSTTLATTTKNAPPPPPKTPTPAPSPSPSPSPAQWQTWQTWGNDKFCIFGICF